MRRQTKWVFAFLAIVFAGSFVFLGVGSGGSALTDFLNGNIHLFGSGGGPSIKSLESKVAKDPQNVALRLKLASALANKNQVNDAIAAYKAYLKLKPGNSAALSELGTLYGQQVTALKSAISSPPTPPLSVFSTTTLISNSTKLGTALLAFQPTDLSITSLQQGESDQYRKLLDDVIKKHVGVYQALAAQTPGDSSLFLESAITAQQDGDTALQLSIYKQFLKKFPNDPEVPLIKKQITSLEKQLRSPQASSTTSGTG